MAKEIIVEASPDGDVVISVNGVKGSSCKQLTKRFEEVLGTVTKEEKTKEYFEKPIKSSIKVHQ